MAKRRVQPGDRHKFRPTAIRIPPELLEELKIRAAKESTHQGRAVSMREVFEKAAEAYLATPIAK